MKAYKQNKPVAPQQVEKNEVKQKKPISAKKQNLLLKILTIIVVFSAIFFSFQFNFFTGLINLACVFLFRYIAKLPVKTESEVKNEKK